MRLALGCVAVLVLNVAGLPAAFSATASRIDTIEHIYGATNINAVTGNGRLAEGVSAAGDVTVLSWPSPSYTDQLAYLSSNALDARSLPRFGAPAGAGLFLGLVVELAGGGKEVTWLRDPVRWQASQSYGAADGPNVVTRYSSADLGLTVTVTDAVRPRQGDADVLVRWVVVERAAESPVTSAWLLSYANLSPTPPNSRIAELPIADWVFDGSNDFAAVWDAATSSIIHFHPDDQLVYQRLNDLLATPSVDYGPIGKQLQAGTPSPAELAALVGNLDSEYAPGSYIAVTTRPAPDEHQIGFDATPLCAMRDTLADNVLALPTILPGTQLPVDPGLVNVLRCRPGAPTREQQGWTYQAEDALTDAEDGELQGSGIAAGEVNEALRTPLSFTPATGGATAHAGLLLGFGPTAMKAQAALATVSDPAQVVQDAEASLDAWLATLHLPESGPPAVQAVARRALINLRVGTDATTGAIVASIARQPPYALDWPRDGTFFNVALDVSGQTDLATRRADLYIEWMRSQPVRPTTLVDQPPPRDPTTGAALTYPADSWEMNYYPDGTPGGPLRFEIDNTALALWSIVTQVGWVTDPADYLSSRWNAIAKAANLLARWRDPATGLQAPASEDDNAAYTETLHGAVSVYGALDVAARAARFVGRVADATRWEARACELRAAIVTHLYDATAGRFVSAPGDTFDPQHAPTGDTAWLVWPGHVLPWSDPRIGGQIMGDLQLIAPTIRLETAGGAYFMKNTVAAALARGSDADVRPLLMDLRDLLASTNATPDTHHFGEAMVVFPGPNGPVASQRVATPHLWEGVLFYLTAMGIDEPQAFDRYDNVLPSSRVPLPGSVCPTIPACPGDCNGDGQVTMNELVTGINIALGNAPLTGCASLDADGDGQVTIAELVGTVHNVLEGCAVP